MSNWMTKFVNVVESTLELQCCLMSWIDAKIGGILYDHGGKPGSNYPDLEPCKKFWNRVRVPDSNYKSLVFIAMQWQYSPPI